MQNLEAKMVHRSLLLQRAKAGKKSCRRFIIFPEVAFEVMFT